MEQFEPGDIVVYAYTRSCGDEKLNGSLGIVSDIKRSDFDGHMYAHVNPWILTSCPVVQNYQAHFDNLQRIGRLPQPEAEGGGDGSAV